jgi:hypothetical protein
MVAAALILVAVSLWVRYGGAMGGWMDGLKRQAQAPAIPEAQDEPPWAMRSGEDDQTQPLRLQVLNATGRPRLALETGDMLRTWGVDALDRGNAPEGAFPETLLIVRGERQEAVAELARRLGGIPVILQRRPDLMLDATLVLGHDWANYRWPG